jgi:hypothetical protein
MKNPKRVKGAFAAWEKIRAKAAAKKAWETRHKLDDLKVVIREHIPHVVERNPEARIGTWLDGYLICLLDWGVIPAKQAEVIYREITAGD